MKIQLRRAILLFALTAAMTAGEAPGGDEPDATPEVDIQTQIKARASRIGVSEVASKYAAGKLIEIGPPAVPALIEMTYDDRALARIWSVYALARIGDLRGAERIIALLEDDDATVRSVASYHGASFPGDGVKGAVFNRFDAEKNPEVLAWMVRGLSEAGYEPLAVRLEPLLQGDSPLLRAHTADALARLKPTGYAAAVGRRLIRETDPHVTQRLLAALAQTGDLEAGAVEGLFASLAPDEPATMLHTVVALRSVLGKAQARLNQRTQVQPTPEGLTLLEAVNTLMGEVARFSPRDTETDQKLAAARWRTWWATHHELWQTHFGPVSGERADND